MNGAERGDDAADARRLNEARFTASAQTYASSRVAVRKEENEALVRLAAPAAWDRVLDVACGPGVVLTVLAPLVRYAVGVDLTAAMLGQAKQRIEERSAGARVAVSLVRGAGERLPFRDGGFTLAVVTNALHHFGEPRAVLREMARAVESGGRVVVADLVGSEDGRARALQNEIERLRDPSHMEMQSASGIAALLSAEGLVVTGRAQGAQDRELGEWLRVSHASVERGRAVRGRLLEALPGDQAGMGLVLDGETVRFVHRWAMVAARKP